MSLVFSWFSLGLLLSLMLVYNGNVSADLTTGSSMRDEMIALNDLGKPDTKVNEGNKDQVLIALHINRYI